MGRWQQGLQSTQDVKEPYTTMMRIFDWSVFGPPLMEQSPGFQISLSFLRLISTSNGTRCCFLVTHQDGSPSPRPLGPGNVPPAGWCPRALHLPGENKGWRRWWVLRAKYLGEEFHTGWGHLGGNLVMLRLRLCFASCSLFGPVHHGYSRVTVRLEGKKGCLLDSCGGLLPGVTFQLCFFARVLTAHPGAAATASL